MLFSFSSFSSFLRFYYHPSEKSPLIGTEQKSQVKDGIDAAEKGKSKEQVVSEARASSEERKSFTESIHEILVKRPRPNPCLLVFYFVSCVAVVASLCLLATQIIPIIIAYPDVDFLRFALRVYVAFFCIVFLLVEVQAPLAFLENNKTFQNYISRGLLYSFNGLIGLEQAYSLRIEDVVKHANSKLHIGWTPLFMQISSWTMVVIGYTYILMGLFCMQLLRDKLQANYQERLDEYNRAKPIV